MTYNVRIDRKNCQGHARCAARAGDLYKLDSDGYIAIDGFDVPPGQERLALAGAKSCPERIIAMVDANGVAVRKLDEAVGG